MTESPAHHPSSDVRTPLPVCDPIALEVLARALRSGGFAVEMLTLSEPGTADVTNLYARIGQGEKHLVFAGHTDVVAPGEETAWSHPPFAAEIADNNELFGRGAV